MLPHKDTPSRPGQRTSSLNFIKTEKVKQNKKTVKVVSIERTRKKKKPEKTTNETEINNLPDEQFKVLVIRMLTELGKRIGEHSGHINKELKSIKKNHSELKNTITEMKKHTRRN